MIKPIRCIMRAQFLYFEIFVKVANLPKWFFYDYKKHTEEEKEMYVVRNFKETEDLYKVRKYLAEKKGFEQEVIEADKIFLKERLQGFTQEQWDKEWELYATPECGILSYPLDAL